MNRLAAPFLCLRILATFLWAWLLFHFHAASIAPTRPSLLACARLMQFKSIWVAVPGYPGMYHTMSFGGGFGRRLQRGGGNDDANTYQVTHKSSALQKKTTDPNEFDVIVMRKGTTLMACVNGQEVIAPQEIEYWKNLSHPDDPSKV